MSREKGLREEMKAIAARPEIMALPEKERLAAVFEEMHLTFKPCTTCGGGEEAGCPTCRGGGVLVMRKLDA